MIHSFTFLSQEKRSDHRVRLALADEDLGDAEVSDFDDHLVLVQQNVLSLEVAVQNQFVVNVVESEQDLHKEVEDGVLVQEGVAALLDVFSQRPTCRGTKETHHSHCRGEMLLEYER